MKCDLSKEAVFKCLKDAGCTDEDALDIIKYCENNETQKELSLLSKQRNRLMDELHESQKKIDCLDYLIYQIEKENCCCHKK